MSHGGVHFVNIPLDELLDLLNNNEDAEVNLDHVRDAEKVRELQPRKSTLDQSVMGADANRVESIGLVEKDAAVISPDGPVGPHIWSPEQVTSLFSQSQYESLLKTRDEHNCQAIIMFAEYIPTNEDHTNFPVVRGYWLGDKRDKYPDGQYGSASVEDIPAIGRPISMWRGRRPLFMCVAERATGDDRILTISYEADTASQVQEQAIGRS